MNAYIWHETLNLDLMRKLLGFLCVCALAIVLPSDRVDYAEFHGYHIFYRYPDERSGNLPEG